MYGNGMIGHAAIMGTFMWVFIVVLLFFSLVGVIYLIKSFSSPPRMAPFKEKSQLDILRTRYTKGEITDDEYKEMKQKLELKYHKQRRPGGFP
jgi:putative membrane protein